ncbi:hypothetical protein T06_3804, partial [Trichinella sp. T6]
RKETTRANVGRKAKRSNHASIKVAVASERAQFSFDVVFNAVVALCQCGVSKYLAINVTPNTAEQRTAGIYEAECCINAGRSLNVACWRPTVRASLRFGWKCVSVACSSERISLFETLQAKWPKWDAEPGSESELVSRFLLSLVSKELHRELYLREPATLRKACQLAGYVTDIEEGRRRTIDDAALANGGLARTVETLARRLDKMEVTQERPSHCPQLRVRTRSARASNSGIAVSWRCQNTEQAGQSPFVSSKVNGLEISLLLDSGAVVSVVPLSTWRYFQQLSEFLVLISEMLLEGGDFLPIVEDDAVSFELFASTFERWYSAVFTAACWKPLQIRSDVIVTHYDGRNVILLIRCIESMKLWQNFKMISSYRILAAEVPHNFRESCHPHLRIGMITAIYAMRVQIWSVRNSANYLFSILLIRIFGPPKKRSLSTSGNYKSDATVTSNQSDFHFFSTFYGLDDIMLELLEQCLLSSWNQSSISSAFLVLTVLTHLYPFKFSLSQ